MFGWILAWSYFLFLSLSLSLSLSFSIYLERYEKRGWHKRKCMCIYIYTYIYMYIRIYVYMYICIYVYMYICIHVYMYICIYVYMYICMYVYMYMYMYICICIYAYMYICIYVYICMFICIYAYMYICLYVCIFIMHIFIYVCIYIHIYAYIYVYISCRCQGLLCHVQSWCCRCCQGRRHHQMPSVSSLPRTHSSWSRQCKILTEWKQHHSCNEAYYISYWPWLLFSPWLRQASLSSNGDTVLALIWVKLSLRSQEKLAASATFESAATVCTVRLSLLQHALDFSTFRNLESGSPASWFGISPHRKLYRLDIRSAFRVPNSMLPECVHL